MKFVTLSDSAAGEKHHAAAGKMPPFAVRPLVKNTMRRPFKVQPPLEAITWKTRLPNLTRHTVSEHFEQECSQ
jgi:hypothetical protein